MSEDQPVCCDFCFNSNVPLFEGGFDSTTRICGFCATRALAEITPLPQPVPEPTPPPERPSKEALLASIPSPKPLVAHLDQFVIGQDIAKRRLALGVSNHYKRIVDCWDRDAPDPIVADPDLHNVRIEKSNILLIGPSGSGKTHLVKSLASYLNVPLVIGDATSLTEAGYVGDDVESLLSKLILERSLAKNNHRSLIQMATGSGKTFTAVNACYRLIKFGGARFRGGHTPEPSPPGAGRLTLGMTPAVRAGATDELWNLDRPMHEIGV